MPALSAEIGIRTAALLQWVEGSTGIGWSKFLEVLKDVASISISRSQASSSERLAFSIAGTIDEIDEAALRAIAELLRKTANDTSLEIVRIHKGSIQLILKGSPKGLSRLQELVNSEELNEVLDRRIQSAQIFFDLSKANLSNTYLFSANLNSANLSSTDLRNADLRNASLSSTNVEGAIFDNNLGLEVGDKNTLQRRGAIFQDTPGSDVFSRSPVS